MRRRNSDTEDESHRDELAQIGDADWADEIATRRGPAAVLFSAPWAPADEYARRLLATALRECRGRVAGYEFDVTTNPDTPQRLHLFRVPTIVLFRAGLVAARHEADIDAGRLRASLAALLAWGDAPPARKHERNDRVSHITTVRLVDAAGAELDTENLDAWELAALALGGTLHRNKTSYQCYEGGWVGDTKPPAGWTPDMWGKCEHAISFPDCRWEVGLVRVRGKLVPIFDYYGSDNLARKLGGADAPLLASAYARASQTCANAAAIRNKARQLGYGLKAETTAAGVRKLTIRIP